MSYLVKTKLIPLMKQGSIKPGDPVNILRKNTDVSPWLFVCLRTQTRAAKDNSKYQALYLYITRDFEAKPSEIRVDGGTKINYEDIAFKGQTEKKRVLVKIKLECEIRQHQIMLAKLVKKYT